MGKSKVMVAVRDALSVESLMTLACQLSRGMDADLLIALHVVNVPLVTRWMLWKKVSIVPARRFLRKPSAWRRSFPTQLRLNYCGHGTWVKR